MAYTLYDKELRRARETLDEIEHQKAEEAENRVMVYEQARNLENEIMTVEAGQKTKSMALRRNKILLDELEEVSFFHSWLGKGGMTNVMVSQTNFIPILDTLISSGQDCSHDATHKT